MSTVKKKIKILKFISLLAPEDETCKYRKQNILYDPLITYFGFLKLTIGFQSICFICAFEMQSHHPVMTYYLSIDRKCVTFALHTQTHKSAHMHMCVCVCVHVMLLTMTEGCATFKQAKHYSTPLWPVNMCTSDITSER
jgi:hypothetical protein